MADAHDPLLDLLHEERSRYRGAFAPPIYRASTFGQETLEKFLSPDVITPPNFVYSRVANPTTRVLEEMLAKLENGEDAVAFGSGMGAISAVLLAFLKRGDHILCVTPAYHPAHQFLETFTERMALSVEYFAPGADIEPLMRPNTRLVYVESPTSGSFEVLDLRAISRVARAHGAISVIDNTWATPLYQKPLDMGIDVSLHSATKYINGHSDAMGGIVVTSHALMATLRPMAIMLGATLSPEDAFLMIRGLRTLAIRMPHFMQSGLTIAHWLQAHPLVEKVLHPGLPNCAGFALGQQQMSGYSSLFGVVLRAPPVVTGQVPGAAFANALQFFGIAPSWGGFESLIAPIDVTPGHAVFRLSIGLEPTDALIADLDQALQRYGEALADLSTVSGTVADALTSV